ncbi:MAG: hypothetical protein WC876_02595 [Candidatus Thermoplasmatota archaeon]|jgi:hypothetical protein
MGQGLLRWRCIIRLSCVALLVAAIPGLSQPQGPTALDSVAFNVNVADAGTPGDGSDDCLLLDMGVVPAPGAQEFDLRLTPCQGLPAGSLIASGDVAERSFSYPQANGGAAEQAVYADLDSDGRYDDGDLVYVKSGPGPGLLPSAQSGTWTVRLTPVPPTLGGHPAGSLVFAADADYQAYSANAPALPASLTWVDADGTGAAFSPPDTAYVVPRSPGGLPAGGLVPVGSILLWAGSSPAPASPSTSESTPPATSSTEDGTTSATLPDSPTDTPSASAADKPTPGVSAVPLAIALAVLLQRRR